MRKLVEGFDSGTGRFWRNYTLAIVSVLAAALVTWACRAWLGCQIAKPFFIGAVMVTTFYDVLRRPPAWSGNGPPLLSGDDILFRAARILTTGWN
jgi:hypothetical protein